MHFFIVGVSGQSLVATHQNARQLLPVTQWRDLNYSDDFFLEPDNDPNLGQSAYIKNNVRIILADQNDNWELALLGKNITDETISFHGSDVPLSSGSFYQQVSPARAMSVQGIWRF